MRRLAPPSLLLIYTHRLHMTRFRTNYITVHTKWSCHASCCILRHVAPGYCCRTVCEGFWNDLWTDILGAHECRSRQQWVVKGLWCKGREEMRLVNSGLVHDYRHRWRQGWGPLKLQCFKSFDPQAVACKARAWLGGAMTCMNIDDRHTSAWSYVPSPNFA